MLARRCMTQVDLWQASGSEKTFILIGPMLKGVPVEILAPPILGGFDKTRMLIGPVVGNEIHQDVYSPCMGTVDEFLEILFRAQARIDLKETGRVVSMITWAGKDRCEP